MTGSASSPAAVVLGGSSKEPPPGIDGAGEVLDLRYARADDEFRAALTGAEVVFSWRPEPGQLASAWDAAGDLRWIQTASAGVDALLFPELVDSDVVVTNARGVFDGSIAEWAIGAMLAFAAGLHRSIVDQQVGVWDGDRETDRLAGSRLTIVGPGPIGRATGARAIALGMSVTMVGRAPRTDERFGEVLGPERLHAALADADYVLDALPFTEFTRGMFDAAAFAAMKPTARFLNVGRGPTVDEPSLVEALRQGGIAGAALDVFEQEPLPTDSPLWTLPGVIVSPHVSGDFHGWQRAVVAVFVDNARRWAAGGALVNVVDKKAGHGAA